MRHTQSFDSMQDIERSETPRQSTSCVRRIRLEGIDSSSSLRPRTDLPQLLAIGKSERLKPPAHPPLGRTRRISIYARCAEYRTRSGCWIFISRKQGARTLQPAHWHEGTVAHSNCRIHLVVAEIAWHQLCGARAAAEGRRRRKALPRDKRNRGGHTKWCSCVMSFLASPSRVHGTLGLHLAAERAAGSRCGKMVAVPPAGDLEASEKKWKMKRGSVRCSTRTGGASVHGAWVPR